MRDSTLDKKIYKAIRNGQRDLVALAASLELDQARVAERLRWLLGERRVVLSTAGYVVDGDADTAPQATLKWKSTELDLLALVRDGYIEGDGRSRISPDGVLEPVCVFTERGQRLFDKCMDSIEQASDVPR
jgi:hypothetical protein